MSAARSLVYRFAHRVSLRSDTIKSGYARCRFHRYGVVSGVLALAGITGAVVGDMQVRMIGVIGYAGLFPVVTLLPAILFRRTTVLSNARAAKLDPVYALHYE